MGDEMALTWFQ